MYNLVCLGSSSTVLSLLYFSFFLTHRKNERYLVGVVWQDDALTHLEKQHPKSRDYSPCSIATKGIVNGGVLKLSYTSPGTS